MPSIQKHQGIALIQVLIISIILGMLAIYISQTVRSQVHTANLIKQNQASILAIESAEAELLHLLTTEEKYRAKNSESVTGHWNFYGKRFALNEDVTVKIQDVSGLLSLNQINRRLAANLFYQLEKDEEQVRVFLDALADWKDADDLKHLNGAESAYYNNTLGYGPRNSYLQSFVEVEQIKEGNILTQKQWREYFSLALISSFNPLNAPEKLLKAYINDDQAYLAVTDLRNNNQLNGFAFFQATGIDEGDFISFRTGRIFNVVLETRTPDNDITKAFTVEVRTNSIKRPIIMTNITWNNS